MPETDPIIIRIQAIDEASLAISKITNSLKQLQSPSLSKFNLDMGNVQHEIISTTQLTKKMVDPVKNFQKELDQMEVFPIERLDQTLKMAGISQRQFTRFLSQNNLEVIKGVGVYDRLSQSIMTQGQAVKQASIQLRRFKFEWLSIMFAGMALDRTFGNLVRSQLELFGVTDLMSSAWTIVLLPVMEKITPILYKLIDAFMNLSPGLQEAIGWIVLFGAGLGKIFSVVGQMMLFLMGLKALLPAAFAGGVPAIKILTTAILGISSTFLLVAGIVLLVLAGMYLAWKNNFLNMKNTVQNFIEGFKQLFHGIIEIIKGILMIIKGIFTGDFELIKDGIVRIFKGLWDTLIGGFKAAFNLIVAVIKGALMIVYNIIKVIIDAVIWLINAIGKVAGSKKKIINWNMPSFKEGGIMPYTGVAFLHAGERIIPRNEVNNGTVMFSPSVTINAEIKSDYDVRKLASELNQYWARDLERALKSKV